MGFSYSMAKPVGVIALLLTVSAFVLSNLSIYRLHYPALWDPQVPRATLNPRRHNVWADLSTAETRDLLAYLHTVPNTLNLTPPELSSSFQNHVLRTEVLRPNKSQALSYVDKTSEQKPPRWAHVVIYNGSGIEAMLDEYAVGPLPPSAETQIHPLTFCHNSGKSTSPNLVPDAASLKDWPYSIAEEISDITQAILGSVINYGNRSDPDGLEIGFRDPWIDSNGRTVRWCTFQRAGKRSESRTILPQGLYVKLDTTGRDPRGWKVLHWFYNNVLYNSTEGFRAAWATPGFTVTPPNVDGDWTHIEGSERQAAPIAKQSVDPTYKIDRERQCVSWNGFEFYMAFSAVTGLTLYDIRFDGERILYELGLQEALSQYAGSDPVQGAARYLDSFWGMGATMSELIPGTLYLIPETLTNAL